MPGPKNKFPPTGMHQGALSQTLAQMGGDSPDDTNVPGAPAPAGSPTHPDSAPAGTPPEPAPLGAPVPPVPSPTSKAPSDSSRPVHENEPPHKPTHVQGDDPRKNMYITNNDFIQALVLWSEILGPAIGTVEMAAVSAADFIVQKSTKDKESLSTIYDKTFGKALEGLKEKFSGTPQQFDERAESAKDDVLEQAKKQMSAGPSSGSTGPSSKR